MEIAQTMAVEGASLCIARQAIVSGELRVFGYELYFRGPGAFRYDRLDDRTADLASARVLLSGFLDGGPEELVDGLPAFINVSRSLLDAGIYELLPPENVVLELPCDDAMLGAVDAVRRVHKAGYKLALDQFQWRDGCEEILRFCDFVKIDLLGRTFHEVTKDLQRLKDAGPTKCVAIRVETQDEFRRCRAAGFDYFEGYFMCRPIIVHSRELPAASVASTRLLAAAWQSDVDLSELERMIRPDATLTYRLLRVANSSYYSRGGAVTTVRRALNRLGIEGTRQWISLLAMSKVGEQAHALLSLAMIRAKLCETLARRGVRGDPGPYFLVGLLSLLDAIMGHPLNMLLDRMHITGEIRNALLHHTGDLGRALACAIALERAQWHGPGFEPLTRDDVQEAYLLAIRWARDFGGLFVAITGG